MFQNEKRNRLTDAATPTLFTIANPPPRIGVKRGLLVRQENPDNDNGKTLEKIFWHKVSLIFLKTSF
jgi:hypothetical protein